jgi:hypothetical protein
MAGCDSLINMAVFQVINKCCHATALKAVHGTGDSDLLLQWEVHLKDEALLDAFMVYMTNIQHIM